MNLITSGLQMHPDVRVYQGGKVVGNNTLASILIGDFALGSILDPLGVMLLNVWKPKARNQWVIKSLAIGIVGRQSVFEPLQTGILAIDSMIPIGRGQRELILGDRYTGKSSIGLDAILNQRFEKVLCVCVSIGQKASSILEVFLSLLRRDAVKYLIHIVASGSSSSASQFISPYTGTSVSEFFMLLRECSCLILQDDLSKHAVAYREIYLL